MKKCIKYIILTLIVNIVVLLGITGKTYAENLPNKFDLREEIEIEVKDQKNTNSCWAITATSLISIYLEYVHGIDYNFSARHMEYATAENAFSNGSNENAYAGRMLNTGGHTEIYKDYFMNNNGPILERNMKFENNTDPILKENMPNDLAYVQVTELNHLPQMIKEEDVMGNPVYKNYNSEVMTTEEVTEYRNNIKEVIKSYGGVESTFLFKTNAWNLSTGAYYLDETNPDLVENGEWHSVILVGWDDEYSKDNFVEGKKPKSDGAFIALNSWGTDRGDGGYIYISYEEAFLNWTVKTYISGVEDIDYDNTYKPNELSIEITNGEILTEVSVVLAANIIGETTADIKVDGTVIETLQIDSAIENIELETPINLAENSNVQIVINVPSELNQYIDIFFHTVEPDPEFKVGEFKDSNLDIKDEKLYIYTKNGAEDSNNEVTVTVIKDGNNFTHGFKITGNQIKNNQTGIYIEVDGAPNGEYEVKFTYNAESFSKIINVTNSFEGTEVDKDPGQTEEIPFVLGDVSQDGKVSIIDLSQFKSGIIGLIELSATKLKAADMNKDGTVSIIDLSRLKYKLVGLE